MDPRIFSKSEIIEDFQKKKMIYGLDGHGKYWEVETKHCYPPDDDGCVSFYANKLSYVTLVQWSHHKDAINGQKEEPSEKLFQIHYTNTVYTTVKATDAKEAMNKFRDNPGDCAVDNIEGFQDPTIWRVDNE